jgi:hypothetical protein
MRRCEAFRSGARSRPRQPYSKRGEHRLSSISCRGTFVMSAPNNSGSYSPRQARCSIGDGRIRVGWAITGRNGGSFVQAEGVTYPEACRKLCEQARTAGLADPAHPPSGGARREWLAACLALIGASVGWFVPLLVKEAIAGASSSLYGHAAGVLCPLLACFGGGIGFACGVMATAARPAPPRAEQRKQFWRGEKSLP